MIESREATVGIVGLGYVGLPLAIAFADSKFTVLGFDVDATKIEKIHSGQSYFKHISSATIKNGVSERGLRATTDISELSSTDVIIICLPTPLNRHREPNLEYITQNAEEIAKILRPGQLVVLESTTYPGTTEEVVLPILEKSGLSVGDQFFLGYSPEREDPNNANYNTRTIPKITSGVTPACRELTQALYEKVIASVIPVSSPRVAEATKLLENIYRAVNIALVNELKVLFTEMGIDIWEVIEAAATKPFGFTPFFPGPGLGGHCIPIDPFYLTWKAREFDLPTRFIELAGEINLQMPYYVINRTSDALNDRQKSLKNAKICVIGIAYKKDIDDVRESPSFKIIALLQARGASVTYHDPLIPRTPLMRNYKMKLSSQSITPEFLESQDCVIIATDHSALDMNLIMEHARLIIDTRNATASFSREYGNKIVKA